MNSAFSRAILRLTLAASLAVLASGCSSEQNTLRMVSLDQRHQFQQTFASAYMARDSSGDADIVLVQDSIQPRHQDPSKPLTQDPCVLPRQIIHIRVFWTPMVGVKADHPANTNASLHWCMVCDTPDQAGVLEYTGSGLVDVDDSHEGAAVHVRKAWMKAVCQRGDMADPLGPSLMDGSFNAVNDPAEVKSLLAEIKSATARPAEAQATAPNTDQAQHAAFDPAN